MPTYNETASGGVLSNGISNVGAVYNATASAGISLGGLALSAVVIFGSGGSTLAGSATVPILGYIANGGVQNAGESKVTGIINEPPNGIVQGGCRVGGIAHRIDQRIISYQINGQTINVSGIYSSGVTSYHFNGLGSFSFTNDVTPVIVNFSFNRDLELLWQTKARIEKDLTFLWNTGRLRIFWYRVTGEVSDNQCPPLQDCCQKFMMNVHARTLTELCEKLSKRKFRWPVKSVHRFTRPAETSAINEDAANGIDNNCNTLEPVEICHIPQCADFCVDVDVKVSFSFSQFVQVDAFLSYETSGSAFTGGSAEASFTQVLPALTYESTGQMIVSGDYVCSPNSFRGRGGIVAGGSVNLAHSRWTYIGGVWPNIEGPFFATSSESVSVDAQDKVWMLPERALSDDILFASSDLSFGKSSQFLMIRNFRLNIPADSNILNIRVFVSRSSTQVGVRDEEVYLISGDQIISDNLADTSVDWPLLLTQKTYGGTALDYAEAWRDPDDDNYLGQIQLSEVNNSDFGIAIRAGTISSLPTTIAKINSVSITVSYEDANGSIVKIGSNHRTKSSGYSYESSGKILVRSSPIFSRTYKVASTGLSSSASSAILLSGFAEIGLHYVGEGFVFVDGESTCKPSYQHIVASGGISASGNGKITPYFETAVGGMIAAGKGTLYAKIHYAGSGSFTLDSLSFTPELSYEYVTSGGISLDSTVGFRLSNYTWVSTGNTLIVSGAAVQKASDIGTIFQNVKFGMEILETTASFLSDVDLQDATGIAATISKCGCFTLPMTIDLSHNLARENIFGKFLARNNFSISRTLSLKYNVSNDSWQTNLHYKGLAPDNNAEELWNLVFDLKCTDVIGGNSIGTSVWRTAIQITRKNLVTFDDFDTRIIVSILPDIVCGLNSGELNFEIAYDTQLNFSTVTPNSTVYQNTMFDNIGLFKNRSWIDAPDLILSLSQSRVKAPVRRIDQTNLILG